MNIERVYFNSSSSKVLHSIFDMLNNAAFEDVMPMTVNWMYEAEDVHLREYGEELQDDFQALEFRFIERPAK